MTIRIPSWGTAHKERAACLGEAQRQPDGDAHQAAESAEQQIRDGEPAGRLLSLMNEGNYALVVAATHCRTGLRRWVMGSVAERLIEASHTPVLLVRSAATFDDSTAAVGAAGTAEMH